VYPLVSRRDLRVRTPLSPRNVRTHRISCLVSNRFAQRPVPLFERRQHAAKRVDRCPLQVVREFFTQRHSRSPAARGTSVIGKPVRKRVLEVFRNRQSASLSENRQMLIVIVERRDLQLASFSELPLCGNLFVPAALQYRLPVSPHQSRKRIELTHRFI